MFVEFGNLTANGSNQAEVINYWKGKPENTKFTEVPSFVEENKIKKSFSLECGVTLKYVFWFQINKVY